MEDILYNILWIDDEHETLAGTKGRAKRNGINLVPFKSLNAGMSELEANYPFYDGVILDAKIFENEDDAPKSEDTEFVHRAKERLLQLKKKFEIFVLTGQAEAFNDNTFKKAFPNVYNKGLDEETNRLFEDVKVAAAKQEDTQIRHRYKRVFNVCTERYIGEAAGQDLLSIIKLRNEDDASVELLFNPMRKVLEDVFAAFSKYQLLPLEFVTPKMSLNESSKFLTGKSFNGDYLIERGYRHLDETHVPFYISYCIQNILQITQPGSHRSKLDEHVKEVKTNFLFNSTLNQLFEVISWFKIYVDSNPKIENWEYDQADSSEWIEGEVINLNLKGFAFFKSIHLDVNPIITASLVSANSLSNGQMVFAQIENYVDTRSGEERKRTKRIQLTND